jgi:hypothetical protein
MGRLRKIEVDDRMPCDKNDEFLFPKCDSLEELWPALLTKALVKLYSPTFLHSNDYSELGDACFYYSLTGYIPEIINLSMTNSYDPYYLNLFKNMNEEEIISTLFKNLLSEISYKQKRKFVTCFHTIPDMKEMNKKRRNGIKNIRNFDEFKRNANKKEQDQEEKTLKISRSEHRMKTHFASVSEIMKKFGVVEDKTSENILGKVQTKISPVKNRNSDDFTRQVNEGNREKLCDIKKQIGKIKNLTNLPYKQINFLSTPQKSQQTNIKFNQILEGTLYSVFELFTNKEFNMTRLKILDFSDLKKRMKESKLSYKILDKEEKKIYIHQMIELKTILKLEKFKRIDALKNSGETYNCLKMKNNSCGVEISFKDSLTDEEFEMAKKCVLNNWKFPPSYFFDRNFMSRGRSNESLVDNFSCNSPSPKKNVSIKYSEEVLENKENSRLRYKDIYNQLTAADNHKNFPILEPLEREEGEWVRMSDFLSNFNSLIILHNPKYYSYSLQVDCNWYNYKSDLHEIDEDCRVFKLTPSEEMKKAKDFYDNNNKFNPFDSCVLIYASLNNENTITFSQSHFYIHFDLINSNKHLKETFKLDINKKSLQIDNLKIDNEYYLVIRDCLAPSGFHLSLNSSHNITKLSYSKYLVDQLNFKLHKFILDRNNIQKNKVYVMSRFIVNNRNNSSFRFMIKSNVNIESESYLKCFFNLYMINSKGENTRLHFNEFLTLPEKDNFYV